MTTRSCRGHHVLRFGPCRISEILATTHFDASKDLQETLYQYQKIYNYHVPQKNLGHITPILALKNWYNKQPELFKKKVYDLSELDNLDDKERRLTLQEYWNNKAIPGINGITLSSGAALLFQENTC